MRSALLAACCKGLSPVTSALFCSAFGTAGNDAYVQFPILIKNARNVHVGDGVQIAYGCRLLLHRRQELRIGDGTTVESFVEFEPGLSITIGRNCRILRGTKVPAGSVLPDGSVYGTFEPDAEPRPSLRPTAGDTTATVFAVIALICFAASASWIGWIALGIAALLSGDDLILPGLSVVLVLSYLGTVGWGEDHTFAADNLVLCLISFAAAFAVRSIAAAVRARRRLSNRPETNA